MQDDDLPNVNEESLLEITKQAKVLVLEFHGPNFLYIQNIV